MKKRKRDIVSIVLTTIIILLLLWLIYSLGEVLVSSVEIQSENTRMSEHVTDKVSNTHNFDELKRINPEINAWIKINDTRIDFPVVQGSNNYQYLNTSAYGESALHGAIFIDYRNDRYLNDLYTLIYGHHMSDGNMFGDISRFKDEAFFNEHLHGTLETPKENLKVVCVAYFEVKCDNSIIYDPSTWNKDNYSERINWIKENALNVNEKHISEMIADKEKRRVVALSTCTSHSEDIRSILLLETLD